MLQANELRLGNLVEANSPVMVVYEINGSGLGLYMPESEGDLFYHEPEGVNPIPITAEWLERFGFSLQPLRQSIYIKGRIKLWLGHNGVLAYLKHEDTNESYFIPKNPQYVHQLQNLYFAMTGEELELK